MRWQDKLEKIHTIIIYHDSNEEAIAKYLKQCCPCKCTNIKIAYSELSHGAALEGLVQNKLISEGNYRINHTDDSLYYM